MSDTQAPARRTSTIGGLARKSAYVPGVAKAHEGWYIGVIVVTVPLGFVSNPLAAAIFGVSALLAVWVLTYDGGSGSLAARLWRAMVWRYRKLRGITVYQPWSWDRWNRHLTGTERMSKPVQRSMRYHPDGADGMAWLSAERNAPGIAWQARPGDTEQFTVTFEVAGRISGLESDAAVDDGAAAIGRYLASFGAALATQKSVQFTTRVLPPDLAWHDQWVRDHLDPAFVDHEVAQSYDRVLRACEAGALVMRHYVTVSWPRTAEFEAQAAAYGKKEDGWRALLAIEIHAQERALAAAGMGRVRAMSARQVTALIRHTQDPSLAPDAARAVDPEVLGLPARDTRTAHVVEGASSTWYHATAMARGTTLAPRARDSLWLLPWLTHMRQPIIRSVAFHLRVVSAAEARARADRDANATDTEIHAAASKGKLVGRDLLQAREEAESKRIDLSPGGQGQGVEWVAYVTASAASADALATAKRVIEEEAERGLGWAHLTWLDCNHAAAMGTTWPLARGLAPAKVSGKTRALTALGRSSARGGEEE